MSRRALILGVGGQDGSYMAELLETKGYEVHGVLRPGTNRAFVSKRVIEHLADVCDADSILKIICEVQPDEIYNFAAQSHTGFSQKMPSRTIETNLLAVVRILEILTTLKYPVRFYQAVTAEILKPCTGTTDWVDTFSPQVARNPYGTSKIALWQMCQHYREMHGLHVACGLPFTHESPRRPETFLVQKVAKFVAKVEAFDAVEKLKLGNLDAERDWGYAPDYVDAAWRILQLEEPSDYVIATGKTHSVRDVVAAAFGSIGVDWKDYVETDPALLRPNDYRGIYGSNGRLEAATGWKPTVSFEEMVGIMVREA